MQITKECFFEGIKYAREGNHLFDISGAIGDYAKEHDMVWFVICVDTE